MPAIKTRRSHATKTKLEPMDASLDSVQDQVGDPLSDGLSDGLIQMSCGACDDVQADGEPGGGPETIHGLAKKGTSGGGGKLPHFNTLQESFGGHDVSGIKSFTGGAADQATSGMGANAFMTDGKAAFKSGHTDVHTAAHETVHKFQQDAGVSLDGGVGSVGDAYERQADQIADKVVKGESVESDISSIVGTTQMKASTTPAQGNVQQRAANSPAVQMECDVCAAKGDNKTEEDTKHTHDDVQNKAVQAKCSACSAKTQMKNSVQMAQHVQLLGRDGTGMGSVEQDGVFVGANDPSHGVQPTAMTYHHIIPRNKLSSFWNSVQANGDLVHLVNAVSGIMDDANDRVNADPNLATSTAFEIDGAAQSKTDMSSAMKDLAKGNNIDSGAANIIEAIFQWWPGNIHQGPTDRPVKIDMEEDDGGDEFEQSAKHVVPSSQYKALEKMDKLIDSYNSSDKVLVKKVGGIIGQLRSVSTIQPYKAAKWYQVTRGTQQGKWRIQST